MEELIHKVIDSHCHLNSFEDVEDVIARAKAAGVEKVVTIGTESGDSEALEAICAAHPDFVRMTIGVHPDSVVGLTPSDFDRIFTFQSPFVVGVGEIGLDYREDPDDEIKRAQRSAFAEQLARAIALNFPVSIHTRQAIDETLDVIRAHPSSRGVFHCFSEDKAIARAALDLGFLISFSGIVTFKKAEAVQEAAKFVPLDRMLIETDAPYLAPVPRRGQRNEPAYVLHTGAFIAELRGILPDEVYHQTALNAQHLFNL